MKISSAFCFVRPGTLAAALAGLLATHSAHASLTWDGDGSLGGSGTWDVNTTANWWDGAANVVWPVAGGTNDDAIFGGTAGTVTITAVTANDLTFNTTGYTLSSGTLTLNGSTPTITTGNGISATISSSIAGSSGLTKVGAGTLTLSGTNTYTGVTTISPGGTLSISQDANLGSAPGTATAGSLVIDGNAIDGNGVLATTSSFTLNANRGIKIGPSSGIGAGTINVATGTVLTYGGIITSSGAGTGGLTKAGAGTLVLSGANTYTGTTTISAGILQIGAATAIPSGALKGDVVVNATLDLNANSISINGLSGTTGTITSSAAGAITLTAGGNNKGGIYNGVIQNGSGTVGFTKTGTGSITLGGNNTFSGGVVINAGTLQLGSSTGLGAATNSVTFGASAPTTTRLQLNGNSITIGGLATNATPGTVVVENANATAATLTINQSTTTTFAGVLQDGTGGGALSLTKSGTGVLTLSGTNIYTGNTTITGGTLQMGSAVAAPSGSGTGNFILDGNASSTNVGILDINGFDVSINGLSGITGTYVGKVVNNRAATTKTITVGSGDATTTFAGLLADNTGTGGTLNLAKTGSGALTLSKANTYSGTTSIKNGSLILGINNALPTGTVVTLGDGTTNASGVLKLNGFTQSLAGLSNIGNGLANRVVNDSATAVSLTLSTATNSSFSGILGGTTANENNFSLVKTGTATMTLSGVNTFSGTTSISQGTLSVGNLTNALGSSASAVILGDASNLGTLSYSGTSTSFTRGLTVNAGGGEIDTTTTGQTLSLDTGGVAASGAFTVGGAGNTSITSNITGTGSLNKTGLGTLTLAGANTYGGATNIKNGTILLAVNDTGLKSTTTLTLGDSTANTNGVLKLDNHTQTLAGLLTTGNGTGNRVVGGNASLSTLTLSIAATNTFGGILGGPGSNENNLALSKIGAGTLTLSGSNTFTGGISVTAGTLAFGIDGNLGGVPASASTANIVLNGGILSATSTVTINSKRGIALGASTGTLDVASGLTLTYGGILADLSGFTGALAKTGTGTLTLTGSSTYTGTTTIKNGTLQLGIHNALPLASVLTLGDASNNSGILKLYGFNQTLGGLQTTGTGTNRVVNGKLSFSTFTLSMTSDYSFSGILGGPGTNENNFNFVKSGPAILTLSGINTYTGSTTISGGTLKVGLATAIPNGAGYGNIQVDGTLDLNNKAVTVNGLSGSGLITSGVAGAITFSAGSNDQTSTFGGVIENGLGTVSFTKVGTGILTLSGANTYTGNTTVTLGTLKIGNASAIPWGTGKGNVALTGALDLNGNSITVNGLSGSGGASSSVAGAATLSVGENNQSSSYGGAITNGAGTVGLTKVGSGTLTLTGVSTFTGPTNIANGTIALNTGNDRLSTTTLLTLGDETANTGGILSLSGRSQTVGGLATAGSGTNRIVNGSATLATFTLSSASDYTFDGILGGTGTNENNFALTKGGAGVLTLTGNNTFTGGLTIGIGTTANNAGIVRVGSSGALNAAGTTVVTFGRSVSVGTKLQLNGNSITLAGLQTGSTAGSPVVENANASPATLTINNSTTPYTYAGVLADGTGGGTFSLIKSNSGTLTLSGTNTYTGTTTITGGTLNIRADGATAGAGGNLGAVPASATPGNIVINGGILQAGTNNFTLHANRGIALGPTSGTGIGTIDVLSTRTLTYNGIIANNGASGTGKLVKSNVGVLSLGGPNTYAGGTDVTGGTLVVSATGTVLGADVEGNNVTVSAGANLSLFDDSLGRTNRTLAVNSSNAALGGIGFSSTSLTQGTLTGMFTFSDTDNNGNGGVLGINVASYATALDLSSFKGGYWFLGSSTTGTYTANSLTPGAGNTYRLGGGGGALTITNASGTLAGTNNLLVGSTATNGGGTVTLTNNQNFTGTTTVVAGTLIIGGDLRLGTVPATATPGSIVLNGGTLSASTGFTLNPKRGIALGPASGSGTGTLDVATSQTLIYAGIIANNGGTGSLTKTGAGTLSLTGSANSTANTYSGTTTLTAGTVVFSGLSDLGTGSLIAFGGGTLQWATGTNQADITKTTTGGVRTVTTASTTTGTIDINGNDVAFDNPISGIGSITIKDSTATSSSWKTLTLNNASTYTGATSITNGTVKYGVANAISSSSAVTLNCGATSAGTLDINGFDVTLLNLAGTTNTVKSRVINSTASSDNTLTLTNSGTSSYLGLIAESVGSGRIRVLKTGTSTLTLGGANTYSLGTTITGGTLSISSDGNLGAGPESASVGNLVLNGGALSASTTFELNSLRGIAVGPASGSGNGTLDVASGTLTYQGTITNNGSGTGNFIKTGVGTLALHTATGETYSGTTAIQNGTVQLGGGGGGTLPSGTVLTLGTGSTGGKLILGDADDDNDDQTLAGLLTSGTGTNRVVGGNTTRTSVLTLNIAVSNTYGGILGAATATENNLALTKTGAGTLTLSGTNTYTGTTTINSGTLSIGADANLGSSTNSLVIGSTATLSVSNNLTLSSSRSIAVGPTTGSGTGTLDVAAGKTLTYNGIIADNGGTGALTKTNTTGVLVLGGANTYSGDTTISGGTLQLTNAAAIPSGSGKGDFILTAGTLDVNNLSATVNGLFGSGTITNSQTNAVTFTAGGNDAISSFGGVIQDGNGTLSFTKIGTGTLTLTAAQTYSGDTTITAGTVKLGIASAIPSGIGKGNIAVNGILDLNNFSTTVNGLSGSGTVSGASGTLSAGAADATSNFAGIITGGIGLTKTGIGTLTLSGTGSNYSGPTTISTGTLAMGSATGISPASSVTISGPGTLDVKGYSIAIDGLSGAGTLTNTGANDVTLTAGSSGASTQFDGVIADGSKAIALTKSGTGTLTLTGVNTYSGATTISNGTISVANPGVGGNLGTATSPVILGDATNKGTLSYTANADLTYTRGFNVNAGGGQMNITSAGKTLTLQTGAITATGTFSVGGEGNAVINSVISGSGGFAKANTGTMLVNSVNIYSGDTTITSGTLQIGNVAALPSGTGKGNLIVNGSLDVNNLNITVNGLSGAGTITNTAGSPVTLTVGDNNADGNFTGILQDGNGTSSLTKIGSGTLQLGGVNTYSGDTTISAGTLQINNAAAIPSGAYKGNVTLNGTLDLRATSITINGLGGSGTVTNSSSGTAVIAVGAYDQTSTFSGNFADGAGTIGLTKTGTGTLTLSGNNTFTGPTTISQGTLSMGSDTGLSAASTLTIGNAGALDLNGKVIAIDGLAGTGSITNNNSGTDVLLTIGSSGGSGTFGGTINDGTGVIGLVKTGFGTVELSNVNTYSGHTTVTGGLLAITSTGALGEIPATPHPANIMLNGGGISATNTFGINSNRGIAVGPASGSGFGVLDTVENQTLTYNGIIANYESGTGGLTKTGLGTLTLGGVNTYSGDTTISTGALQVDNALAIPSGTGKGNLVLNATLDLNNTSITVNGLSGTGTVRNTKSGPATLSVGDNDQSSTFAGILENGNGLTSLTKVGTGTLTLAGTSSTYTGTTTVAAGTLSISQDANLGGSNSLVINAGATLAATSTFTLATNRGIAVGPSGAGIIDVAPSQILTYGGAIANNGGSGGFTKTGTGTLILTGISTYTGTTTVESGVMTVNGNIGGSGATVVKTGATLNGMGTTGAMDVQSDGTLQPGDGGIGTLTVSGRLTLAGIANFELGTPGASHASTGTSDRVDVTGDVVYGGTINLIDNNNAGGLGSAGAGSYKLITYTGTSSGTFAGVTGLPKYHNAFHDVPADNALYIDLYDYAVATVTESVDLGRIHAGGAFGTQALKVGNSAPADDYTESLGGVFGTTAAGFTSSGSVTGIAGQSNNDSNMIVGISDNTAGQKTGSIGVNFTSQAVSGSGLANTELTSQNVTVTGFAYSGQSVWKITGSGSWGNNVNAYDNWTLAGGVAGLDGILSVNDTATFGNATAAPSTVNLDGANPTLSGIRFDHDQSYTLALGTGGSLTLKGNSAPALVANDNGNHTISTPLALAGNANVSVTHTNDTLTISGAISGSGNGITKSGDGTLALTGNSGYTGATLVSAGTLLVNGSLGNTSTTIASGATLAGNGTLGGPVTVNGNIAPGLPNEIGTIGVFSVYVDHMMSIDWNGTTNTIDQVNIIHEIQLGELSTIVFNGIDGVLLDSAYVFATYDTFTGPITHFGTVVDIPTGYAIDYAYGAGRNQIALVAVPEQGASLLGGLGILFLLRRRREGSVTACRLGS